MFNDGLALKTVKVYVRNCYTPNIYIISEAKVLLQLSLGVNRA